MFFKKFVYFHIDELNRDTLTAVWLAAAVSEQGMTLVWGNRLTSRLLPFFGKFFSAIILPKPHFLETFYIDANRSIPETRHYCLYTENIGIIASQKNTKMVLKGALDRGFMEGREAAVNAVSGFFFWGNQVRDVVVNFCPELEGRCHVVGHPRHSKNLRRKKSCGKNSNPTKYRIGFITRHCSINDYYKRPLLERVIRTYASESEGFEYYRNESDNLKWMRRGQFPDQDGMVELMDAKNMIQLIKSLQSNGVDVSLKVHPREDASVWMQTLSKVNLKVDLVEPLTPFTAWASDLDLLVGPPSTSFYDAYLLGVPVVSIGELRNGYTVSELFEENNDLMRHIPSPTSMNQAISLIKKLAEDGLRLGEEEKAILAAETLYPNQEQSLSRVAEILAKENSPVSVLKWLCDSLGVGLFYVLRELLSLARAMCVLAGRREHSADFSLSMTRISKIQKMIYRLEG